LAQNSKALRDDERQDMLEILDIALEKDGENLLIQGSRSRSIFDKNLFFLADSCNFNEILDKLISLERKYYDGNSKDCISQALRRRLEKTDCPTAKENLNNLLEKIETENWKLIRGQCYKTFFVRKLRIFVISQSVSHW
jgi:hypothetical protein